MKSSSRILQNQLVSALEKFDTTYHAVNQLDNFDNADDKCEPNNAHQTDLQ